MSTLEQFTTSEEYLFAKEYDIQLKKGIYIPNAIELNNKSNLDKYNNFKNSVIKSNPIEYKISDFEKIDRHELNSLFSGLVFMYFGEGKNIEEEIMLFLKSKKIIKSLNNEPLDGQTNVAVDLLTGKKILMPKLPSIDNISSVICMLHEFTHFHIEYNNLDLDKKKYYSEILPIYMEKIGINFMENLEVGEGIEKKIENSRISGLKYHFESIDINKKYKILRNNNLDTKELNDAIEIHKQYFNALSDSYGIGYIYAENLLQMRLDDSIKTDDKILQVLNKEISLQELLDYYNINIKNKNTIERAKIKIKKMTK